MLTKEQIMISLSQMGIKSTDTVLIHTSLRAIGDIENGGDGLIDAFCEYLCDGLFLIPAHTWNNVTPETPVFDVLNTPSCIGTLPNIAVHRKDGLRSLHPTHSVVAFGKTAAEFIKGEENIDTPASPDGCWGKLYKCGAKILLLGVNHSKNTYFHFVDELLDIPQRLSEYYLPLKIKKADGTIIDRPLKRHTNPYCDDISRNYVRYEIPLKEAGAVTYSTLGNAEVRVCDAVKCAEVVRGLWEKADRDLCV